MSDDKKIIFSMVGVSKTFPPHKQVLKDIYLSFFYGAKIGIIGLNGSGKSTLLKIIAGIEKEYQGDVVSDKSFSVGYLEQDPKLDETKTVIDIVREGVQPIMDMLAEYEDINLKFGLPEYYENEDKMNSLFARQAELQDKLDASDAWSIDNRLERAMDALRCPPEDQPIIELSGGERRRVALCRLLLQEPDGFLNLTVEQVFHGRVITPHRLNKKLRGWLSSKSRLAKDVKLLSVSLIGLIWLQKLVKLKVRLV